MHIKYSKISALHKEECEGILDGDVYIQEKIDGANLSVRYNGGLCIGSRTQLIYSNGVCHKAFRGAQS